MDYGWGVHYSLYITISNMETALLLGSNLLQVGSIICDPTWSKSDPSWRPVSIFESVIDTFRISGSTLRHYNWTPKGIQNYLFRNNNQSKVNWFIALGCNRLYNLEAYLETINADKFALFVENTIEKIRSEENDVSIKIALIFANESFNIAKKVEYVVENCKIWPLTLLLYTPE